MFPFVRDLFSSNLLPQYFSRLAIDTGDNELIKELVGNRFGSRVIDDRCRAFPIGLDCGQHEDLIAEHDGGCG